MRPFAKRGRNSLPPLSNWRGSNRPSLLNERRSFCESRIEREHLDFSRRSSNKADFDLLVSDNLVCILAQLRRIMVFGLIDKQHVFHMILLQGSV